MYNHAPSEYINPFKLLVAGEPVPKYGDQEPYVFYRDEILTAFISTKQWPNNHSVALIVPNEVYENLYDIPDEILAKIHIFSKRLAIAMKKVYECDGVSVRQHNEPAGNQDVWHYHLHVFPRYKNDYLYTLHKYSQDADTDVRKEFATKLRDYFSNN
ncbi:HIT domain-containing protein [Candidatus Kaiserbacteria bacterium]|nr:HIT domain-containing protein [Candidatus Kaiserbacteria bacterium]